MLTVYLYSPGNQTYPAGNMVSLDFYGSASDMDPLTYTASGLPSWLTIDGSSGSISGTVPGYAATNGTPYSITVTATDTAANVSASQTIALSVGDAAPTVNVNAPNAIYAGAQYDEAAATVTGVIPGVDNFPASSLERVTPTLTYYVGTSGSGTPLPVAPQYVGTYTVVAFFPGSQDHTSASAEATFTISQATPTLTITAPGGTYSGSPSGAESTVMGVGDDFSLNQEEVTANNYTYLTLESVPVNIGYFVGTGTGGTPLSSAPIYAGVYTAEATFAGSVDYTTATSTMTFTIAQATPILTLTDSGDSFNGTSYPATVTIAGVVPGVDNMPSTSLEGIAPTLAYFAGSTASGTPLPGAPTSAGTYTVVANFAGSLDYAGTGTVTTFSTTNAEQTGSLFSDGTTNQLVAGILQQAPPFTISFWYLPAATGAKFDFGSFGNSQTSSDGGWGVFYNDQGMSDNKFYLGQLGTTSEIGSNSTITGTSWHQIVISFDDYNVVNDNVSIYIDGNLDAQGRLAVNFTATNDYSLFFNGATSDLRFYNQVLSPAEVSDLYNFSNVQTGLVDWWPMNEATGAIAHDVISRNTMTLQNYPTDVNWSPLAPSSLQIAANGVTGTAGATLEYDLGTLIDPLASQIDWTLPLPYYSVSFNWGDGSAPDTVNLNAGASSIDLVDTHEYPSVGSYDVTITVEAADGRTVTVTTNAEITAGSFSLAPLETSINAVAGYAGTIDLASIVSDIPDPSSDYSVSIDWGEGGDAAAGQVDGSFTASGSYMYTTPGTYTATVTVTLGPTTESITVPVTVSAVDTMTLTPINQYPLTSSSANNLVLASFTDPLLSAAADTWDTLSNYTATVNWGDGTTGAATIEPDLYDSSTWLVVASHNFTSEPYGSFSVTVSVTCPMEGATSVSTDLVFARGTFEGMDDLSGASWISQQSEDQTGMLIGNSLSGITAQFQSTPSGIAGVIRTIVWDPTILNVYSDGVLQSSGDITLTEADGVQTYDVTAGPDYTQADSFLGGPAQGQVPQVLSDGTQVQQPRTTTSNYGPAAITEFQNLNGVPVPGGGGVIRAVAERIQVIGVWVNPNGAGLFNNLFTDQTAIFQPDQRNLGSSGTSQIDYSQPIWQINPASDTLVRFQPVSYTAGSTPQIAVTVLAQGLAQGTVVNIFGQGFTVADLTTNVGQLTIGANDMGTTQFVTTTTPTFNGVNVTRVAFNWQFSLNGGPFVATTPTSNPDYVTLGTPVDSGIANPSFNARALAFACTTTADSPNVLVTATGGTSGLVAGQMVNGPGVPAGTTILRIVDNNNLVLSANVDPVGAGIGVELRFGNTQQSMTHVTADRLLYLTTLDNGLTDPNTVVANTAYVCVNMLNFNIYCASSVFADPWTLLNAGPARQDANPVLGGDCITQSTLLKMALDEIGINPTQTSMQLVFGRNRSWDGLASPINAPEFNPQGAPLGFGGGGGGGNNFEGCLLFTTNAGVQQWWMGASTFPNVNAIWLRCTTDNTTTVTAVTTAGIIVGQTITGDGIPGGTTVTNIVNSTTFTISQAATMAAVKNLDILPNVPNCTITFGSKSVTVRSTMGMVPGQLVAGLNIPVGTTIASITNATTFVLSNFVNLTTASVVVTLMIGDQPFGGGTGVFCATTNRNTNVTMASTAGIVVGQSVTGPGIAAGTTVAAITNGTTIVLSQAATLTSGTNRIVISPNLLVSLANGNTAATIASTAGMAVGQTVTGPGIAPGTTVAGIVNGTTFFLSAPALATGAGFFLAIGAGPATVWLPSAFQVLLRWSAPNISGNPGGDLLISPQHQFWNFPGLETTAVPYPVVPNTRGMTLAQATAAIRAAGYTVGNIFMVAPNTVQNSAVAAGLVYQNAQQGTTLAPESAINLWMQQ